MSNEEIYINLFKIPFPDASIINILRPQYRNIV